MQSSSTRRKIATVTLDSGYDPKLDSLPRDASAERGNATVSRPSVCLSVCLSVCP